LNIKKDEHLNEKIDYSFNLCIKNEQSEEVFLLKKYEKIIYIYKQIMNIHKDKLAEISTSGDKKKLEQEFKEIIKNYLSLTKQSDNQDKKI